MTLFKITTTPKHNHTKSMGCSKSSPKREFHSDKGLPQKTRKISNKQPNLPPKINRGNKQTNKTKNQQKKGKKIRK